MTILNSRPNTTTVSFQIYMDVVKRVNYLQVQLDLARAELREYREESEAIRRLMQER